MVADRTIRFGLIGCGLMGREFAVAAARWPSLLHTNARPEILAICDIDETLFDWFTTNFPSIKFTTRNYEDLLARKDVEAIYCAVPHNLHERLYREIVSAGKHLFGEKPFGIDLEANRNILRAIEQNPNVFVRCSSEFPYYPGGHRIHRFILDNVWGRIVEVNSGFLHSTDLNPDKPINWKRMVAINGEYGCMGDLGMHALHLPVRARWIPNSVYASLSNIVPERSDDRGETVPCETWDNASLQCEVEHPTEGYTFPMTVKTYRIAPGGKDTWYIEILGTEFSARYSTKYPKTLQTLRYEKGGTQAWMNEDLGYESAYETVTASIFEFGFTDAILQMWAAFIDELSDRSEEMPFGCVTPEETHLQHKILTAALESGKTGKAVQT